MFVDAIAFLNNYCGVWVLGHGLGRLKLDAVHAQAMLDLDPRWNVGAIFLSGGELMVGGLLARAEVQALDQGHFPSTLAQFGVPGPSFQPGKVPKPARGTQPQRPGQGPRSAATMLIGPNTGGGQQGSSRSTQRRPGEWDRHNDDADDEPQPKRTTAKGHGRDEDDNDRGGDQYTVTAVVVDKHRKAMATAIPVPLVGNPLLVPVRNRSLAQRGPPAMMKRKTTTMTIDVVDEPFRRL